ncbi:MAG: GxxExxY protein [Alphaproteobacteria bacterium]|nr:GxxExxY protein [Alphaproteobacteria bacterium]
MNDFLTTEHTEITELFVQKFDEQALNNLSGKIIDCAIYIHRQLGPGLLESAYQKALAYIFTQRNIPFEKETFIPVKIDGVVIDDAYRADFVVADTIIIETKSVKALQPMDEAQLLNYMRLGGYPLGLLMNFNVKLLKDGIIRRRI